MLHAYAVAADAFTSTPAERAALPDSWWLKRVDDPDGLSAVFGAFCGEELVGTVALEFSARSKTRHKAHLVGMFVSEPYRGQGIGCALLQQALQLVRAAAEIRVLSLTVTEGNGPAIRLYESCGFQAFGVEPLAIATPDGLKSKVHMWLDCRRLL